MNCGEIGMHGAKDSSNEIHKNFYFHFRKKIGRHFLKRISTYCTKCNETNLCHLDIQKHFSYEKYFKYYIFFAYKFKQKFSNTLRPIGENF